MIAWATNSRSDISQDGPALNHMPFFSIGYFDKDRLEVTLASVPGGQKAEGSDWIEAQVEINVGAFKGKLKIDLL